MLLNNQYFSSQSKPGALAYNKNNASIYLNSNIFINYQILHS